ncbi:hypothetical protein [Streptomyces sp. V4I2]|uniref:hypothetical protein n=1 Tax=Streptomyces sp. V4I2 TaxID=3042280 RepID=UPI00277F62F4|nr:hypothetical protein [Streptomyces sp. V4I2]MDQ1041970.1 hypothetical protein [Streptomyces sp. V4I2]
MRRQRVWAWAGLVVGGLLAAGLIVLVVVADLDTAGQVAGIAGTIVGLAALAVSVYALQHPRPQSPAAPEASADSVVHQAGDGDVANTISGGTFHGPALQGRDFSNTTFTTQPHPPSSPPAEPGPGTRPGG